MLIVLWEKRFFFVAVKNNQNTRSWPKMHFSLDETNVWRQDSAWEACDDPHHEGDDEEELCTFTLWYQPSLSWPQVCSSTCSSRSMWSLGLTEISGYWRRPWDGGGGMSSPSIKGCCFSSEEGPHGRPAAWPSVTECMRGRAWSETSIQWLCRARGDNDFLSRVNGRRGE